MNYINYYLLYYFYINIMFNNDYVAIILYNMYYIIIV